MNKLFSFKTLQGGQNPVTWNGTLNEAMKIALAEIHEHAGGSSAAYTFTAAIFKEFEQRLVKLQPLEIAPLDSAFRASLTAAFRATWAASESVIRSIVTDPDDSVIRDFCMEASRLRRNCAKDDLDAVDDFYAMRPGERELIARLIVQNWC